MANASTPAQKFVEYALRISALELVPKLRQLKSGRMSPYFFNSGLFNSGSSMFELAYAYADASYMRGKVNVDVLFGPPYKGIPIVTATAMVMYERYGLDVGYAFSRKEAKDHGEGGLLVGSPVDGLAVAILDDVTSSGGSIEEAMALVQQHGGDVKACVIAFDRQEQVKDGKISAAEAFRAKYGVPLIAAARLDDLVWVLQNSPPPLVRVEEILPLILAYREQYGA